MSIPLINIIITTRYLRGPHQNSGRKPPINRIQPKSGQLIGVIGQNSKSV